MHRIAAAKGQADRGHGGAHGGNDTRGRRGRATEMPSNRGSDRGCRTLMVGGSDAQGRPAQLRRRPAEGACRARPDRAARRRSRRRAPRPAGGPVRRRPGGVHARPVGARADPRGPGRGSLPGGRLARGARAPVPRRVPRGDAAGRALLGHPGPARVRSRGARPAGGARAGAPRTLGARAAFSSRGGAGADRPARYPAGPRSPRSRPARPRRPEPRAAAGDRGARRWRGAARVPAERAGSDLRRHLRLDTAARPDGRRPGRAAARPGPPALVRPARPARGG